MTFLTTLATTAGSGVRAQDLQIAVPQAPGSGAVSTQTQQAPAAATEAVLRQDTVPAPAPKAEAATPTAASLAAMIDATPLPETLSPELECLAGAIYFEAKSESQLGQLAVGRVVVTRAGSGRFPASYCGVVYQPSQFSFVRGRAMPPVNRSAHAWQQAVRVAIIADKGAWKSPVEGAMFFHAARVSPAWGKLRMARVDNHVFYR